jgi:hypothetical protein
MTHTHSPQTLSNGMTLYVCSCGARKQKSQIINGKKVEVWKMESKAEEAARQHAVEMIQTEDYGYDWNKQDISEPLDSQDPRNQD